jgi:hypothetical protein
VEVFDSPVDDSNTSTLNWDVSGVSLPHKQRAVSRGIIASYMPRCNVNAWSLEISHLAAARCHRCRLYQVN